MKTTNIALPAFSLLILFAACKPPALSARSQKAAQKNKAGQSAQQKALAAQQQRPAVKAPAAKKGGDWNQAGIDWMPFEQGLQRAKAEHKPICLIFSTQWCPHCRRYSGVFHDAQVVEMSKKFVMIHLDKDKNKQLSKRFAPDGEYIPRTYFLDSNGQLDAELHVARPRYKYFYDEKDPQSLLGGMRRALKKLK